MELHYYIQAGIALLGLLSGIVAYFLGLRIRHDILENNQRIDAEISKVKESITTSINALRNELVKEFDNNMTHHEGQVMPRIDRLEHGLTEVTSTLTDKILGAVNGKYVRTELYNQGIQGVQERFSLLKELIESNMKKIEDGLDQQLSDLKDRIFHDK